MLRVLKGAGFVVLSFLLLLIVLMLELPFLPIIILSLMVAFLIYRSKRIPTKQGLIAVGVVLGAWIWTFEYVPPGQVDRDMRANDVQFQEVVGKYSMGDGLGLNWDMEISSSGRFYLFWRGCLGIYGRSKGWIGAANGSFILHPNLDLWKVIRGIRVASEELIPVRWG